MNHIWFKLFTCIYYLIFKGFTPDVKLWEVEFDKGDNFKKVCIYTLIVDANI